ncbi:uncharacterized protein [Prorops nasuta]|uniref:uncharacterized protein n=1 Tax=Prorops nasuta TaxID=863751 RepID=UPI0034CEF1CD
MSIMQDLPAQSLHANFVLNIDQNLKTLGVTWNAKDDNFYYTPKPISLKGSQSKRSILSEIAKIFDPLGLLAPIILYLKKLMQDIWRIGTTWDESLPQNILTDWMNFVRQWGSMHPISFGRKLLLLNHENIQLHGFCDASNIGYGACIYVRSSDAKGNTVAHLLSAKSRVAPLKLLTTPRLELCGALLLAQLYHEISSVIDINQFASCTFWCDSTIVLHWLMTPAHKLKMYVANRVINTKQLSGNHEWRYVASEENPADALSRGQLPYDFVKNQMWIHGPTWLIKSGNYWPVKMINTIQIPKLKEKICASVITVEDNMLTKFSSYAKTVRVIAYCLRFRKSNKYKGFLNVEEINEAEICIIRLLQKLCFSDILIALNRPNDRETKKFANLSPFIDERGVIRVGERLHKSNLSFAQKHPILLPKHHLTECLIRETHQKLYHTGIQTTLYNIRKKFWLSNGKNYVRKII